MSKTTFTIFTNDTDWHIAVVNDSDVKFVAVDANDRSSIDSQTVAVRNALKDAGHNNEPIALALPSNWSLAATVNTQSLPRRGRHESLVYALEEKLPLPAEKLITQFIIAKTWAIGISSPITRVMPVIQALSKQGLKIDIICPAAILALQFGTPNLSKLLDAMIIIANDKHLDIFCVEQGRPRTWHVIKNDSATIKQEIEQRAVMSSDPIKIIAIKLDQNIIQSIGQLNNVNLQSHDGNTIRDAAALGAHQVLAHKRKPWINMRAALATIAGEKQTSPNARMLAIAALILVLSVPLALIYRAAQYNDITNQYKAKQTAIFNSYFPQQKMPVDPLRQFNGELRKLKEGLGLDNTGGRYDSSLRFLYDALRKMPTNLKIIFTELEFSPHSMRIKGIAASSTAANRLLAHIENSILGFKTTMPVREDAGNDDGSIRFVLISSSSPKKQTIAGGLR